MNAPYGLISCEEIFDIQYSLFPVLLVHFILEFFLETSLGGHPGYGVHSWEWLWALYVVLSALYHGGAGLPVHNCRRYFEDLANWILNNPKRTGCQFCLTFLPKQPSFLFSRSLLKLMFSFLVCTSPCILTYSAVSVDCLMIALLSITLESKWRDNASQGKSTIEKSSKYE